MCLGDTHPRSSGMPSTQQGQTACPTPRSWKRPHQHLRTDLGAAGIVMEWRTDVGVIREQILKFGLHDVIMGNPVITLAVMRIFDEGVDE